MPSPLSLVGFFTWVVGGFALGLGFGLASLAWSLVTSGRTRIVSP